MISAMPSSASDSGSFATFYASMPTRYKELFDDTSAREHEAIVARRGDLPVHIELWRRVHGSSAVVCVVADDKPGLLSLISAALVAHGMDVVAVQAYTRGAEGNPSPVSAGPLPRRQAEAVDFFWLKREGSLLGDVESIVASPILAADIAAIGDALRALVTGVMTVDALLKERRIPPAKPPGATTRVTFAEDPASRGVVLTVETFDRPGLLLAITRALFRAGVQILGSEATTKDGRVVDRFTVVEGDGTAIRATRRGVLQMEVLRAIESLAFGP
jgi:[protein-PII] uridylyltransferase